MRETWVPSLGREDLLEKGKATPLQYSGLENPIDCIVHGLAKSRTQLSDFHFTSQKCENEGIFKIDEPLPKQSQEQEPLRD